MTLSETLSLLLFGGVCAGLMAGFPVAFTLGGVSLIFGLIGNALGVFDMSFFGFIPNRIFGVMTNEVLLAVPLFVFMGVMLERSASSARYWRHRPALSGRPSSPWAC